MYTHLTEVSGLLQFLQIILFEKIALVDLLNEWLYLNKIQANSFMIRFLLMQFLA